MLHVLEIAAYNLAIAAAGCSGAEAVAVALAGVAVLTSTVRGDDELATFPTRLQLLLKVREVNIIGKEHVSLAFLIGDLQAH
jgi:hypothetical protein